MHAYTPEGSTQQGPCPWGESLRNLLGTMTRPPQITRHHRGGDDEDDDEDDDDADVVTGLKSFGFSSAILDDLS